MHLYFKEVHTSNNNIQFDPYFLNIKQINQNLKKNHHVLFKSKEFSFLTILNKNFR